MKILQWRKMLQKALWTVMAVYGKTSPPLACVKLPVLKLVFTLKSFNVSMVQGLQWFLRTCFSPLLSQEEEQQSSSVFQINTSLDTCESLNKPWRIYFMSQSVLALGFTGPSWAREQIPETGMRDGGKESRMLPQTGGRHSPQCHTPTGHYMFKGTAGRCGKELTPCWGGILPSHKEVRIHQNRLNSWVTKPKTC